MTEFESNLKGKADCLIHNVEQHAQRPLAWLGRNKWTVVGAMTGLATGAGINWVMFESSPNKFLFNQPHLSHEQTDVLAGFMAVSIATVLFCGFYGRFLGRAIDYPEIKEPKPHPFS